mmetsp:Transcript_20166/g.41865  ORF Transcript_20166/g.41865 Transcript_20166/m.41865 type:complete len:368 (+) Transcript_20166:86-1189(+)
MLGCYFLMLPSRGFDVDAGACSNFCRPSTIVLTLLGILNPWSFLVYRGGKGSILLRLSRNRRYVSQVFVLEKPGSFLKDRFVLVPRVVGRNVHVHRSLEDTDRRESVRLGIVVVVVVVAFPLDGIDTIQRDHQRGFAVGVVDFVAFSKIAKYSSVDPRGFNRNKLPWCRRRPAPAEPVPFFLSFVRTIDAEEDPAAAVVVLVVLFRFRLPKGLPRRLRNLQGRVQALEKVDEGPFQVDPGGTGASPRVSLELVCGSPDVGFPEVVQLRHVVAAFRCIVAVHFVVVHEDHQPADPGERQVLGGFPQQARPDRSVETDARGSDQTVRPGSHRVDLPAVAFLVVFGVVFGVAVVFGRSSATRDSCRCCGW